MQTFGKTIMFHIVCWWGKPGTTSMPGYNSTNPNTIGDQLAAMEVMAQALGFSSFGVIALTYGLVDSFIAQAVTEISQQCSYRNIPFALCFDPWTVSPAKTLSAIDATMISTLQNTVTQAILNSRSYLQVGGKPVILDFGTGISKAAVNAAIPNLLIWQEVADFAWWQNPPATTNNNVTLPCLCLSADTGTGPNRNMDVWNQSTPARIIPAMAGNYYYSLAAAIASTAQLIQYVTWNDWTESTALEGFAFMLLGRKIGS